MKPAHAPAPRRSARSATALQRPPHLTPVGPQRFGPAGDLTPMHPANLAMGSGDDRVAGRSAGPAAAPLSGWVSGVRQCPVWGPVTGHPASRRQQRRVTRTG